ncbi:MAG: lysophospholipid acyltransferase family protein [Actinomycetota bacterium]
MGKGAFLYRTFRWILSPLLRRLYQIQVEGLENLPSNGPVIVVANHTSFMDSIWIPLILPRRIVYLTKAEYFDSWKTVWFFRGLGMIPVDRQAKGGGDDALSAAHALLDAGGVLGLYPEGTRSPDGRLYRGRTGVGRLAVRSGAPVVPIGLIGSSAVMSKGARIPKLSGEVTVKIGKPIDFSRFLGKNENDSIVRAFTDEIMFQIMTLSGQQYVDQYAIKLPPDIAPEDYRRPSDEMLG